MIAASQSHDAARLKVPVWAPSSESEPTNAAHADEHR